MVVFVTDLIISVILLCKIKSSLNEVRKNKDMTYEVKELVHKQLKKNLFLIRRLLNAFPHFVGKDAKILISIKKLANKMKKTK